MIITRMAGKEDASLIAELSRQTFWDTFAIDNSRENMEKFFREVFTVDALKVEVNTPGNLFVLAFDEATPVGYARLKDDSAEGLINAMEIARIYAIKESIGKGVGRALMEKCIEIALQRDKQMIWLGVWEKNIRAITFYTRWGFEKFGTHTFMLGDDPQTDWLMKKQLVKPTAET